MATLLHTKLQMPRLRPLLVPRPALVDRLHRGLGLTSDGFAGRLTLVSAPAGFGKTTLVVSWLQSAQRNMGSHLGQRTPAQAPPLVPQIAWLSLDEDDNDPQRFFSYLAAAVSDLPRVGQTLPGLLQAPQRLPPRSLITAFLQDATAVAAPFLLVLDDYHQIDNPALDETLAYLLTHMPAQMHLVITSRTDPALPLSRLRAKGQLNEIRQAHLRFDTDEAAHFLNQIMGLDLKENAIAALENRTEGWIAGLQLAAISLQGSNDTARFIAEFAGSHRYIMDYLADEVLLQQPPDMQQFLRQTAVLQQLHAPLCDAVLRLRPPASSQTILEYLERANLFLIPLDNSRQWYRYHHLFADLLQQRLRQTEPDLIPQLHLRASHWFAQEAATGNDRSRAEAALHHAIAAAESNHLAMLLVRFGDDLWEQGSHLLLRSGLNALPPDLRANHPQLSIYHAWLLLSTGQHQEAARHLQQALQMLRQTTPAQAGTANAAELRGRVYAAQALVSTFAGNTGRTITLAQEALTLLPTQESAWSSSAAMALGDAHSLQGDMREAAAAYADAVAIGAAAGNTYLMLVSGVKLAMTQRQMGQLHIAQRTCKTLLAQAEAHGMAQTAMAGCLYTVQGEILSEWHRQKEAVLLARKGATISEQGSHIGLLGWSYLNLARVLMAERDNAGIEAILEKVARLQQQAHVPPWILSPINALRVLLWTLQGKPKQALQWAAAQDLDIAEAELRTRQVEYLVVAQILTANGRFAVASSLLERLHRLAAASGRAAFLLEIELLQTLIAHATGKRDDAHARLQAILKSAEPEGYIRLFVEKGAPVAELIAGIAQLTPADGYVKTLQQAFSTKPDGSTGAAVEPLSERELEVLHLIATGLKNKEIAARLVVSLNTVLYHTKNIYSKLQVKNRTQAVNQARKLDLL